MHVQQLRLINPTFHRDTIEWFHQQAGNRKYDEVGAQAGLALAAIHTTGDRLFKTISKLTEQPKVVEEIRHEVAKVIATYGFNENGVYYIQLLDSALETMNTKSEE